jgi:hypothetical protein
MTPVPTKAPVSGAVALLLKEAQAKQQDVKSARGLMEIKFAGSSGGKIESATMAVDFEMNEPNMRMAMKMQSAELPMPMDIEFIVVDKTAYMNMGGEWMAFPADQTGASGEMDLVNMGEMEEFLSEASDVKSLGRRTVKGVECEVIGFTLSQAKMLELARDQGKLGGEDELPANMGFEDFKGEFAIGVQDQLLHQMVIDMSFFNVENPKEHFEMDMTFTLWDLNAPNIVIKAPSGVQPFGLPKSTPLPRS